MTTLDRELCALPTRRCNVCRRHLVMRKIFIASHPTDNKRWRPQNASADGQHGQCHAQAVSAGHRWYSPSNWRWCVLTLSMTANNQRQSVAIDPDPSSRSSRHQPAIPPSRRHHKHRWAYTIQHVWKEVVVQNKF